MDPASQPAATRRVLPTVAIVGRPNVGKSSLLNALARRTISIVEDMPGVTRDRISTPLRVTDTAGVDRYIELVDTGGYGFIDSDDLTEHIKQQIEQAMALAQLVLFVVDCDAGLTAGDTEIATLLRSKGIKTVLLANKADSVKSDVSLGDFARLGLGTPLGISATNKRNIDELDALIARNVDLSHAPTEIPEPTMLVAIVGKRNAGKSTLVNAIAKIYEGEEGDKGDRVIVSEVPGTTRDSVDVRFEKDGKALVVIDTAGVRKMRHMVTNDIEFYSFHRAERSIRRADIIMLLIDATERISDPDKKLAGYIAEQHKPVVLVVNKWDLARKLLIEQAQADKTGHRVDDVTLMEQYRAYIDRELRHLDYAPIAFVTAKEGRNVQAALDLCQHLFNQTNQRVSTSKLNTVVREIMTERGPSTKHGRKVKVYYVTQSDVAPPQIVLFVNNPDFLTPQYERYMINRMREMLPFPEVPIRLFTKARKRVDFGTAKDMKGAPPVDAAAFDSGKGDKAVKVRKKGKSVNRAASAKGRRGKVKGGAKKNPKIRRKREGA
ncbi:ribosome biogenesis GTPase Der [Humisphaera borealis]|uniref:GTPase Der n=1 Tax=Humisphaera borealis TaxID=2807512 RepID=A0A7M2WWB2_9BACT|nr:ribosome biogenesis GTPase Der [Humisphaera borealis]QOV89604.1 ribosome biogenesis GTPase Der [Humisphaera borealis]